MANVRAFQLKNKKSMFYGKKSGKMETRKQLFDIKCRYEQFGQSLSSGACKVIFSATTVKRMVREVKKFHNDQKCLKPNVKYGGGSLILWAWSYFTIIHTHGVMDSRT